MRTEQGEGTVLEGGRGKRQRRYVRGGLGCLALNVI